MVVDAVKFFQRHTNPTVDHYETSKYVGFRILVICFFSLSHNTPQTAKNQMQLQAENSDIGRE
jgi:hypothetical protein